MIEERAGPGLEAEVEGVVVAAVALGGEGEAEDSEMNHKLLSFVYGSKETTPS